MRRGRRYRSGDRYSCEGRCPSHLKFCRNLRKERKDLDKRARRVEDRETAAMQDEGNVCLALDPSEVSEVYNGVASGLRWAIFDADVLGL